MSNNKDISEVPESTKYGALGILRNNPLAANPNESEQPEPSSDEIITNIIKDASNVAGNNGHEQNGDFDDKDIQRKMNGLIDNLQPRSVTPDEPHQTPTNTELQRPQSPFVGEQTQPSSRITSPQITKDDTNILVVNQSTSSDKHEQNYNKSQQQQTTGTDKKLNLSSSSKGNVANEQKSTSRQRSSNQQEQKPLNSSKSSSRKTSPTKQQLVRSRTNSTKHEPASPTKDIKESRRSSTPDSDNEVVNKSKLSQRDKSDHSKTKQIHQSTDNEKPSTRPQSPNVQEIAEHNQVPATKKTQNTDEQNRILRRSNSAESSTTIPLVDDKSIDSRSINNTESEQHKRQRSKTKSKDVETNTDPKNATHNTSTNDNYQQHPKSETQKPSKSPKPTSNELHPTRRPSPTKEPDSNEDNKPDKKRSTKPSTDNNRPAQSDTEQMKIKKRRRPKRISRTTQTYECVFRRMQTGQHEELLPTNDTDKNIQTRQSILCPRSRSPKKHIPIYLSTDAFKSQESSSSKKYSQDQRNTSPQNGKLLILRSTAPLHRTNPVNVQRISLLHAIDLLHNENNRNSSTAGQRNKSNAGKQSDQKNNLPRVQSSPAPTANIPKTKSDSHKTENRTYRRKNAGAV